MAAMHPPPPLANGLQPLSCLRCVKRKVRCDRLVPCCNCIRYNVPCEFPEPRTEKRQRKRVAVACRRAPPTRPKHERHGERFGSQGLNCDCVSDSSPDAMKSMPFEAHSGTDEEPGVCMDGPPRTLPNASLCETEVPHSDYRSSELAFGLSPAPPGVDELWPSPQHVRPLWQTYLSNIQPVTMILHAPTAGDAIAQAAEGSRDIPEETHPLLFAIMACALMSIDDADCVRLIGQKRLPLLARYRLGCEVALRNASFLTSSSLLVLQAYTVYLLAIRPDKDPSEFWNLTGIAKRNAQRLGLHRGMAGADSTPFQLEIRRRVWLNIVLLDDKATHAVGMSDAGSSDEVHLPASVDDADLSPHTRHRPDTSTGASEMLFCILLFKVTKLMSRVHSGQEPWVFSARDSAVDPVYRAERAQVIGRIEKELELEFLRYCDMLNPVHFLAVLTARLTLCKLRYVTMRLDQCGKDLPDCPEEEKQLMFATAVKVLEYESSLRSQPFIQAFSWHTSQHLQWSCVIPVLDNLKIQPCGDLAEKAWEHIRILYECRTPAPELHHRPDPLHPRISTMVLDAWQAREARFTQRLQSLATPPYIARLREHAPAFRPHTPLPDPLGLQPVQAPRAPSHPVTLPTTHAFAPETLGWQNWAALETNTFNSPNHSDAYFSDSMLDSSISTAAHHPNPNHTFGPHHLQTLLQHMV